MKGKTKSLGPGVLAAAAELAAMSCRFCTASHLPQPARLLPSPARSSGNTSSPFSWTSFHARHLPD